MSVLDNATKLAIDRNRLAYERTMMAWTRTSISLITFGFTIYKFFQIEVARSLPVHHGLFGSATFAVLMIAIGLVALLLATLENRRDLKALQAEFPSFVRPRSSSRVLAFLVSILGIFALFAVILRR